MTTPSDLQLLRTARTDGEAFCGFYERHANGICRFLEKEGAPRETAVDLTAEAFAQALLSLHRFRGHTDEEARGWIYGIARNLGRQYRRRSHRETTARQRLGMPLRSYGEYEAVEELADAGLRRTSLRAALGALSDDDREALTLRVVEELPYEAVAAQQGIGNAAARKRVSRALTTLRIRLKEHDHDSRP